MALDSTFPSLLKRKNHTNYDPSRVRAAVKDIATEELEDFVPSNTLDFVTLIFVLSALSPESMPQAVAKLAKVGLAP